MCDTPPSREKRTIFFLFRLSTDSLTAHVIVFGERLLFNSKAPILDLPLLLPDAAGCEWDGRTGRGGKCNAEESTSVSNRMVVVGK